MQYAPFPFRHRAMTTKASALPSTCPLHHAVPVDCVSWLSLLSRPLHCAKGKVRCIAAEFKQTGVNVAWNVSNLNVFLPAWMVPPVYHSIYPEEIKCRNSRTVMGVNPNAQPGLKMRPQPKLHRTHAWAHLIKKHVLPLSNHPKFEAPAEVANVASA